MKSYSSSQETNPQVQRKVQKIRGILTKALQEIKDPVQKKQNYLMRISLNLESQKLERMLDALQKGYLVKKHSPSTSAYHNKYVYISEDHRFFCWKSPDKNDQKRIQLRKVENVIVGSDCKGMLESKTYTDDSLCFILVSEVRALEIQCSDADQLCQLTLSVQEVVKNSKRMHLSYRF